MQLHYLIVRKSQKLNMFPFIRVSFTCYKLTSLSFEMFSQWFWARKYFACYYEIDVVALAALLRIHNIPHHHNCTTNMFQFFFRKTQIFQSTRQTHDWCIQKFLRFLYADKLKFLVTLGLGKLQSRLIPLLCQK